ncbi:MAG: response regulator transcription factor [Chthoniobacterales bacterium]|nr:response regulator transcription factor [Chthoniobacterales bacterium]
MPSTQDSKPRILVVEDETDVRNLICLHLKKAGYRLREASDGLSGLAAAKEEVPDLVILDLMLPEMRGEDVCRALKAHPPVAAVPVIMLTAKAREEERVAGLELGADDYLTKPFSPRELVLRVQALLRRSVASAPAEKLAAGPFELDRGKFDIRMDGSKLDLTAMEFKLLAMLMENHGRTLGRDRLMRDVWGYRSMVDSRTVDTHMRRLRAKLGKRAACLETVRGEGYRFRAGEEH